MWKSKETYHIWGTHSDGINGGFLCLCHILLNFGNSGLDVTFEFWNHLTNFFLLLNKNLVCWKSDGKSRSMLCRKKLLSKKWKLNNLKDIMYCKELLLQQTLVSYILQAKELNNSLVTQIRHYHNMMFKIAMHQIEKDKIFKHQSNQWLLSVAISKKLKFRHLSIEVLMIDQPQVVIKVRRILTVSFLYYLLKLLMMLFRSVTNGNNFLYSFNQISTEKCCILGATGGKVGIFSDTIAWTARLMMWEKHLFLQIKQSK